MALVKNTFGLSLVLDPRISNPSLINTLGGSSENRSKSKPKKKKEVREEHESELDDKEVSEKKEPGLRTMSKRTKSKIRSKIMAFAQVHDKLTFLTLTFLNQVEDRKAVKILKTFLDNAKKRFKDFEYIWIAEKQTKNQVFVDNIHFHLITNKYWPYDKWWTYWVDIQKKQGILPRVESFKPTSAFNVKKLSSDNTKGIGTYLTKYVTKNSSAFKCQVWNCSKKISRLYTSFYSDLGIIDKVQKLQSAGLLDGEIKSYKMDYCNVNVIPLNKTVMKFYNPIANANKQNWKTT